MAALSLLSFAGCKKKGGAAGEAVAKMESFKKDMCECKDKACADKVNEAYMKWGSEMAKTTAGKDEKPDPDLVKKTTDIMAQYSECMTKASGAGGAMGSGAAEPAGSAAEPAGSAAAGSAEPAAGSAAGSAK
ncbi:MAG TPA: hypothetical protein VFQ53_26910 [Kofleriaceae bacterium]|nr:hypothetical protein [Kofleriaceae bacterium]